MTGFGAVHHRLFRLKRCGERAGSFQMVEAKSNRLVQFKSRQLRAQLLPFEFGLTRLRSRHSAYTLHVPAGCEASRQIYLANASLFQS